MMRIPLLDLRAQYASIREEALDAIARVVESQRFILGPEVEAFEREAAEYCRCRHAVGCSSGTDALLMALMALGVGPGDEVVTSAFSFFATAGSIARLGARPVFADIDPVTFNVSPEAVRRAITERTRAVIPVHLYGRCAEMGPILRTAEPRGIAVIEDAAQAIGAEYDGRRAGSIGAAGCFSFYPSKNLGGFGDGGMVTTNDDELAAKLKMIRVHGSDRKYHHRVVGGNFRLDEIQAAVLRVKLRRLDDWTRARQRNAARYDELFRDAGVAVRPEEVPCLTEGCRAGDCVLPGSDRIVLPSAPRPGERHVFNQYVIRTGRRDAVVAALEDAGIGYEIYYPVPLPLQECFRDLGARPGDFPAAECAARTALALPMYPELTPEQQEQVVEAVVRGLRA